MSFILVARCTDEQTWLHRARLESLYEHDREIKAGSFFRHVRMKEVAEMLGYAYGRWQRGVRLLKDWHLSFHRSKWRSVTCYHLEWSGIDYVFVRAKDIAQMSDRQFFD